MDSSEASQLNAATALLYDDADGSVQKCRIFDQPDAELSPQVGSPSISFSFL